MTGKELIVLRTNPKINPSFQEGAVTILTKNYTELESYGSEYLKKGVCCLIKECGLSKYPNELDEQTGEWSSFTDDIEWCYVEIVTLGVDPYSDEVSVRAEDLQPYIPITE